MRHTPPYFSTIVTEADLFRVGTIGRLVPSDVDASLATVRWVLEEPGVQMRASGA